MQHPRSISALASRLVLGLGVALAAAACSDGTQDPTASTLQPASPAARSAAATPEVEAELRHVASAIAAALGEPDVRLAVRDAMRDSPWDAHQLVLQEFAGTAQGRLLVDAAARAAGETPERFAARVAALPPLDFYAPFEQHRTSWRGTPGVVVAATLNAESGATYRYGVDGRSVPVAGGHAAPAYPVLALNPAEAKARRYRPQPAGQGDVIQSPRDGEQAVTFTWIEPGGDSIVVSLEDVLAGRDPRFGVVRSAADGPTYLRYVKVRFDDAGDDLELNLDARFYRPDGALIGTSRWSNYSFPPNGDQYPNVPLIQKIIPDNSTARINVAVWEDDCDCFGNGDDHYGSRDFYWNNNEVTQTIYDGGWGATDVRLGWTAISAPAFSGVSVSGAYMYTGQTASVSATAVDQYGWPLAGYTVSAWSIDNPWVASITSSWGNYADLQANGVGSTYVRATINGVTGAGVVTVEQNPYGNCENPGQIICEEM